MDTLTVVNVHWVTSLLELGKNECRKLLLWTRFTYETEFDRKSVALNERLRSEANRIFKNVKNLDETRQVVDWFKDYYFYFCKRSGTHQDQFWYSMAYENIFTDRSMYIETFKKMADYDEKNAEYDQICDTLNEICLMAIERHDELLKYVV